MDIYPQDPTLSNENSFGNPRPVGVIRVLEGGSGRGRQTLEQYLAFESPENRHPGRSRVGV